MRPCLDGPSWEQKVLLFMADHRLGKYFLAGMTKVLTVPRFCRFRSSAKLCKG
jgi:hypothetical protein